MFFGLFGAGKCENCKTPFKGGIVEKHVKMADGCWHKFCPRCARGMGQRKPTKPGAKGMGYSRRRVETRGYNREGDQYTLW